MVRGLARFVAPLVSLLAALPAAAQVAGENVNMVSGTQWPGGDPFLQRQNEPTLAVSSVNPQHLLAAANDYRSVDLPAPDFGLKVNGDAWLGVFKSLDGGQTWKSVLLPGYPQDPGCRTPPPPAPVGHVHNHRCGHVEAAPTVGGQFALCGLPAAADPVVRAGTDGMFFVGGINFQRDKTRSRLFLARYVDANNKENGDATRDSDALRYVDTRVIAEAPPNVFIDKPWFAVDVPRAGASTCSIPLTEDPSGPKRTFLGGTVYAAWAEFALPNEDVSTLKYTWSKDCGRTWVTPIVVNTANSILNQGVSIAIEPISGRVFLSWRRFAVAGKQGDAILVTRTEGRSKHFSAPRVISKTITPFEQGMTASSFRAEAFPSLAISTDGTKSWAHVAWSQRKPDGDGRVYLSTAQVHPPPQGDQDADEAEELDDETRLSWSTPTPVDDAALGDDAGHTFSRGHQAMPSLSFSQGRLVLVYYDTRLDHTRRYYKPRVPFAATDGRYYQEELAPLGELAPPLLPTDPTANPGAVWTPYIDDAALTQVRHTVEVRVAVAGPGATPRFSSLQASRFPFGLRGDEFANGGQGLAVPTFGGTALEVVGADGTVKELQQLQHNPPNLPIFKNGTRPFMGDYIDIQGPTFVATPTGWLFNTAPTAAPVFHAVWTSNQDVKLPPLKNGAPDWAGYTPIGGGGKSLYDPSVTTPACQVGYAGTRDQNIYTSRITEGLAVSSPQNQKQLSATETRTFVVAAQNTTPGPMTVDFAAALATGSGAADFSFVNDLTPGGARTQTLRATIPAGSTASRTVFARSSSPGASIKVTVTEACAAAPCRAGFVTLNPPIALGALLQPDGKGAPLTGGEQYAIQIMAPNVTNPNVTNPNVTNPNVTNPNVTNPNVTNPNVTNPNVTNPNVTNPNVTNPNVTNPNVTNPNVTNPNVTNPNVTNPNVTNPNVTNPNVTNPNVTNPNVTNAAVSDLSYTVANTGNTTTTYQIQLVSNDPAWTPPTQLQLIVSRTYFTPAADGCALKEVPHDQVLLSVPDVSGALVPRSSVVDPNVTNPNVTNATLSLPPGETAVITLRALLPLPAMAALGTKVGPAIIPQSFRPQAGVTYANIASLLPGAGVVVPGAPSTTTLNYDGVTGQATIQVRPASGSGTTASGQVYLIANDTWRVAALTLDGSGNGSATLPPPPRTGMNLVAFYAGDASYAGSVSASAQFAAGLPTTTAIVRVDLANSMGSLVTVDVAGTTPGGPMPTGTFSLTVNGVPIPNGGWGFSAALPAGSFKAGDLLVATYSGDATFAPSTSAAYVVTKHPITLTVTFDRSGPSVEACVYPTGIGPLGTMVIALNGSFVTLGIPTPTGRTGVYEFCLGSLQPRFLQTAATDVFTATFSGDPAYADATASTTAAFAPASVSVSYDIASSQAGARVSAGHITNLYPSGVVTFLRNGSFWATGPLQSDIPYTPRWSGEAVAQVTIPQLSPGDVLTASFPGDSAYAPAISPPVTVAKAGTRTMVSYDIASSTAYVDTYGSAAWPITGTVTFTINGIPLASAAVPAYTVSQGHVDFGVPIPTRLTAGTLLVATYSGDGVYEPSSSSAFTVARFFPSLAITSFDIYNSVVWGLVTGASSGPMPTGLVNFYVNSRLIGTGAVDNVNNVVANPPLQEGDTLGMAYGGDAVYQPGMVEVCCVVRGATSTSVTGSDVFAGTVTAQVSRTAPSASFPAGTVTVTRAGAVVGTGTVATSGSVIATVTNLSARDVLVVQYAGSRTDAPSSSALYAVPGVAATVTAAYDPAGAGVDVAVFSDLLGVPSAPSGAVDLYADGAPAASITLTQGPPGGVSIGSGSLSTPPPTLGKYLQAHYQGDRYFSTAASAPQLMTGFALARPAPTARRYHATVAIGTNLYVLGGRAAGVSLTTMDAYDTLTGTWSARAALPGPIDVGFNSPAVAMGGRIYAFRPGLPTFIYDPTVDAWSTATSLMPNFNLHDHAVALGSQAYIFSTNNPVVRYDPATDTFTTLSSVVMVNRGYYAAAAAGGKVYLIGGVAPHNTGSSWSPYLDSVEVFDPAAGTEGTLTPFPSLLSHRVELDSAAEVNGKIYVSSSVALATVPPTPQVIDPVAGTITEYPVGWSVQRYGVSADAVNGVIYFTGGVPKSATTTEVPTVDAFFPTP